MDLKDIISKIAIGRIPKKPEFLLNATFAFSHRGEFENSNQPPPPSSTVFIPQTQVGYLTFDGQGGITGNITVNRNGGASQTTTPNGAYTLVISNIGIATGTIITTSQLDAATIIEIEYSFVVADNWRELKYAVQKATVRDQNNNIVRQPKVLVYGTMKKIYS